MKLAKPIYSAYIKTDTNILIFNSLSRQTFYRRYTCKKTKIKFKLSQ
jgi:hypothetical protein